MANVLVVGSSNTDYVVKMDRFPDLGETILGVDYRVVQGGKGANQAVAAARLGAAVAFVCKVGNDQQGRDAFASYRADGLNLDFAHISEEGKTGAAFVLVNAKGQNLLMVASGANMELMPGDLDAASVAFKLADICVFQLENPLKTVMYGIEKAHHLGKRVILNPAPAQALPASLLQGLYLLTPNEKEAGQLTGRPVQTPQDALAAATQLWEMGVANVVVTLGSEGALWVHADGHSFIPGRQVAAVDTTAAGDVFNAALAVALAEGSAFPDALHFANQAAAISVTRLGAQPSAPYRRELD